MKALLILPCLVASLGMTSHAHAINYGDYRSETLVSKAWMALEQNDIETVMALADKCLELYEPTAQKMQANLKDYPQGKSEIFNYWALNDIGTILFIQGEVYRRVGMPDEAKESFKKIVEEYSYAQTWDNQKEIFWRPKDAAADKLFLIESGLDLDFGDYSSVHLTTQAWKALDKKDFAAVRIYTDKVISLYARQAREMQADLTDFPAGETDEIHSRFWALNDVGTSLFIRGKADLEDNNKQEAIKSFQILINNYSFAQCWDPRGSGFFWKPSEAARRELDVLQ